MILMSIENRIGPPVEGKDFYGRKKELQTVCWTADIRYYCLPLAV